jgi:hypothetical protein
MLPPLVLLYRPVLIVVSTIWAFQSIALQVNGPAQAHHRSYRAEVSLSLGPLQSIEHTGIQDSKTSSTQHTTLGSIEPQPAEPLFACTSKMVPLSPSALKADPYSSDNTGSESSTEPAPRKRRRPRINRDDISASSTLVNTNPISTPARRLGRLPHKQIERKYREGLNLEIERLRKAVPTLLQSTDSCVIGAAKPSKGMVLAAAIRYILEIEEQRDSAINEIERLGGTFRVGKLNR